MEQVFIVSHNNKLSSEYPFALRSATVTGKIYEDHVLALASAYSNNPSFIMPEKLFKICSNSTTYASIFRLV